MSTQLLIRIDPELKRQVDLLARAEGKNTSALVRDVLRDYVRQRDARSAIDTLWSRIGQTLEDAGATAADVETTIEESRRDKR